MTYVTIEANIANGQIVPNESIQLPEHGRALVTLLPEAPRQPNWERVEAILGILQRPDLDSRDWQQKLRSQWDRD